MTLQELVVQIKNTLENVRQQCLKNNMNNAVQEIDTVLGKINMLMGGIK